MSFLSQKPEGIENPKAERRETGFGGVLPVVHGTQRCAFRHVEQPWNYRTHPTGSHGQDPADFYQMAGVICHGPVDKLRGIYFRNRPYMLHIPNPKDGSYYIDLEIWTPFHPMWLRFYWGYDDQPADPILSDPVAVITQFHEASQGDDLELGSSPRVSDNYTRSTWTYRGAPNIHPPYGGICMAIWYNFETGFPVGNRSVGSQIVDIDFEVVRHPDIVTGSESDDGANPTAVEHDYLTHPRYGLALPDAVVPSGKWQDGADRTDQYRWTGLNRLSPSLSKAQKAATAISNINWYYGGLLLARDGEILPGIIPERGDANFTVRIFNHGFNRAGTGGATFEHWTPVETGASTITRDMGESTEGEASLRIDVDSGGNYAGVYQDLKTVTAGLTYNLRIRAKADATGAKLKFTADDWTEYGQIDLDGDWGDDVLTFTAVDQGLRIISGPGTPAAAKIWVDFVWGAEEITEISAHDIEGRPTLQPTDSQEPPSEVTAKFLDITQKLETNSVAERYSMPSVVRGEPKTEDIDAEFVRKESTARILAKRMLQARAGRGKLNIMRAKARRPDGVAFLAGDVFRFDYAPWNFDATCRITKIRDDGEEFLPVEFEIERTTFPEDYEPAEDVRNLPPEPVAEPFVRVKAVELPKELSGAAYPPAIALLCQRESESVYAYEAFLSENQSAGSRWTGEEASLGLFSRFAAYGTLTTDISAAASSVAFTLETSELDQELAEGFGAAAAEGNTMIALVGGEWLSLAALVNNVGNTWTFNVLRARAGTTAAGHAASDPIWLLPRDAVATYTHVRTTTNDTLWFRLIPRTITAEGSPSAEFSVQLALPPAPRDWDWVKLRYDTGEKRGFVRPTGFQVEIGDNSAQELAHIDDLQPQLDPDFGEAPIAGENWPRHGLRRVYPLTKSEWAVFPFRTFSASSGSWEHFEGRQRTVAGAEESGAPAWQNLDGGEFLSPIGPSQITTHSIYAERLRGGGGFEIGTSYGNAGSVTSHASGSGTGWVSASIFATAPKHVHVKIPIGTTYRFSFCWRHIPD